MPQACANVFWGVARALSLDVGGGQGTHKVFGILLTGSVDASQPLGNPHPSLVLKPLPVKRKYQVLRGREATEGWRMCYAHAPPSSAVLVEGERIPAGGGGAV